MIQSEALFKLLKANGGKPERHIIVDGEWMHIIPEGEFTEEEIKELRSIDEWDLKLGYPHFIANFLPDDVRPEGVKKL